MRTSTVVLLMTLVFPSPGFGGAIGGYIDVESPGQATLEIACGSQSYTTAFRIPGTYYYEAAPDGEKCKLTVGYGGQSPSIEIQSRESAVRYDLELKEEDGKYSLKRK